MPASLLTKASPRFFLPLGTIYFALRCDGSSGESIDPSRALASFKAEHLIGDIAKSLLTGRRVFHRWKRSTMFTVFLKWCATLISWTGIYAQFMPVDCANQFQIPRFIRTEFCMSLGKYIKLGL